MPPTLRLVLQRLASLPLLLGAVTALAFLLLAGAGGDAFTALLADPQVPREQVEALRAIYGLDRPLLGRYLAWLGDALQGELGLSLRYRVPVAPLVGERLGNTLLLTGSSLLLTWALALPLGALAARRPRRLFDRALGLACVVGQSVPRMLLALLALLLAAASGLLPVGGMHSARHGLAASAWSGAWDVAWHAVLPVAVLTVGGVATLTRQVRALVVEALGADHVTTARALGFPERVVLRHALRHAANPLVSQLGQAVGQLLAGSFLVEILFSWPGLATLTYEALLGRDVPLVLAGVLLAAGTLIVGNLLADLGLLALEPRLRSAR